MLKVNGEIIPPQAIEFELARLLQFYSEHMSEVEVRKQINVLKDRAKQQAIGAKLLIDEAVKLDLQVSQDDIQKKNNEMIKSAGGHTEFDAMLKKQNLTQEMVREGIGRSRKVDLMVDTLVGGISDPTEEDIQNHFQMHSQEYMKPARASAQHILIKVDNKIKNSKALAKARLEAIKRYIKNGANFADKAAMNSDCSS